MRILIPTADYPPIEGGISSVALHVSRELARMGHEVEVVAPYFPGMDAFDAAEPVRVTRFRGYGLGFARFLPMFAATWPKVHGADLLIGINVAYGGIMGYAASKRFGIPYVVPAYAYEFLKFGRNGAAGRLLKRVYERATVVTAISGYTRDRLVEFGVAAERVDVIPPGAPEPRLLDAEALSAIKRKYTIGDERVILAVGRFIPRKGHVTLVSALPRLLERFPNTLLIAVGRGETLRPALQEAHALGVRQHTLFPGCVSDEDLAGLYQLCDVFALPTGEDARGQVEGFGLVFTEAQAYGKPVIAGRSGGVVDAVLDGETGLLVEPNNPEGLADALCAVLGDGVLAARLGKNGRRRVETELNWRRFTERLLEAAAKGRA